jgi:hypothetical protein
MCTWPKLRAFLEEIRKKHSSFEIDESIQRYEDMIYGGRVDADTIRKELYLKCSLYMTPGEMEKGKKLGEEDLDEQISHELSKIEIHGAF